eukprot:COSAG01_NODE_4228_length_5224_cov_2.652488_3_plen_155_part_00
MAVILCGHTITWMQWISRSAGSSRGRQRLLGRQKLSDKLLSSPVTREAAEQQQHLRSISEESLIGDAMTASPMTDGWSEGNNSLGSAPGGGGGIGLLAAAATSSAPLAVPPPPPLAGEERELSISLPTPRTLRMMSHEHFLLEHHPEHLACAQH